MKRRREGYVLLSAAVRIRLFRVCHRVRLFRCYLLLLCAWSIIGGIKFRHPIRYLFYINIDVRVGCLNCVSSSLYLLDKNKKEEDQILFKS